MNRWTRTIPPAPARAASWEEAPRLRGESLAARGAVAGARGIGGYARWTAAAPETRGLAAALTALYPAGEIGHLAGADPRMLGAFAAATVPAAFAGTWKAHRSRRYSAAAASLAAGVPAWLATAAATGITNLPVLLGYTTAAAAGWSAVTWSDVMKDRREAKARAAEAAAREAARLARWQTVASAPGLEGARLIRMEDTKTGDRFTADIRSTGSTASHLASGNLAEHIAAIHGLPAERVRTDTDPKHAGNLIITVQTADPWAGPVTHPALAQDRAPARRSIMDGPLNLGTEPDTGEPLTLNEYDDRGAWHTSVVAATGGGKTTLYSNMIAEETDCCDTLVYAIDLRKGTIPYLWGDALDYSAGLAEDGTPEYDKALAILEWCAVLIKIRSAKSGGRNHVPTPDDPAVRIHVDEGDTLLGAESPIALDAKKHVHDILCGGRSAGVGLNFAGQRLVVQYTGSKDLQANAGNKIILRVNNGGEMGNAVPGWELAGMPDMSTYAPGVPGVALVVAPDKSWRTGRIGDLHDFDQVMALARRRGRPQARFSPETAAALRGYLTRHEVVPGANVTFLRTTGPRQAPDTPAVVAGLTGLASEVNAALAGMPAPPDPPTSITELIAARNAIRNADDNPPDANRRIPVPDSIARPVLALLAERGEAGVRLGVIVARFGKPESTVRRWLRIMRDHGLIAMTGNTRGARYYLPEHVPQTEEDNADDDVA